MSIQSASTEWGQEEDWRGPYDPESLQWTVRFILAHPWTSRGSWSSHWQWHAGFDLFLSDTWFCWVSLVLLVKPCYNSVWKTSQLPPQVFLRSKVCPTRFSSGARWASSKAWWSHMAGCCSLDVDVSFIFIYCLRTMVPLYILKVWMIRAKLCTKFVIVQPKFLL